MVWLIVPGYRILVEGVKIVCHNHLGTPIFSKTFTAEIRDYAISPLDNGILIVCDNSLNDDKYNEHNLALVSWKGDIVWIAETPVDNSLLHKGYVEAVKKGENYEGYLNINIDEKRLFAWSVTSFLCEIDLNSGKILSSERVY